MPRVKIARNKPIKKDYTNPYGVTFSAKEVKQITSKMESINKKIDNLYRKLRRQGLNASLARQYAGDPIPVSLVGIKNKNQVNANLETVRKRSTMRYITFKNEVMITNILTVIKDRYGLDDDTLERLEDGLRGLTVTQFALWYDAYGGIIDAIFDDSPKVGERVISQDEIDHAIDMLELSLERFGIYRA